MKAYLQAKYASFIGWACWKAWDYARKRELARRPEFEPLPVPENASDMSPHQRRTIAMEARQLLDNRHFREAFGAMEANLEAKAAACDPGKDGSAQRIIIAKQILIGLKREIVRKVDDGYMAEVQLNEIEQRRRALRFVR